MKIFLKVSIHFICSSKFCALGLCIFKICIICRISEQMKYRKTGAQLGGGGASPVLFWKSKKVHWFWKKSPNCVHPCVESSVQIVVLRVSRRKSPKIFPCGAFFGFLIKRLSKCPNSTNLPCPEKFLIVHLRRYQTQFYRFCFEMLH